MTKEERINTCIKLTLHPKFDILSERHKETLTYLASGMSYVEIGKIFGRSRAAAWMWQNAALKRMGFIVFKNGSVQRFAMNLSEINRRINK